MTAIQKSADGKTTQIIVEEGGFEFVTPNGQTLLRIQRAPSGGAALTLFGANGLPAVFLNTTYYGGDLGICRNDGNPLIRATAYEDEGAFCVFGKGDAPIFAVPAAKLAAARGQAEEKDAGQ